MRRVSVPIAELARLPTGAHVVVRGTLRATVEITGPVSERALAGCDVVCTSFAGVTYVHRVAFWTGCWLDDESGSVVLALDRGYVRAPAVAERVVEAKGEIERMLHRLRIASDGVHEIQLIERGVANAAYVEVRAVLVGRGESGFRTSAKESVVLAGRPSVPLAIVPK